MRPMMGLMAGVIVGLVVTAGIDALHHLMFPPPPGTDLRDPAALALLMAEGPLRGKIAVLAAWGLGIFAGAGVAFRVAREAEWPGWVVGFTFLSAAGWMLLRIPFPFWMVLSALVVMPAAAFAAARLFQFRP